MKTNKKIIFSIFLFFLFWLFFVYATFNRNILLDSNKSSQVLFKSILIPWEWLKNNQHYLPQHHVWSSWDAQVRFSWANSANNIVYDSVTRLFWQSMDPNITSSPRFYAINSIDSNNQSVKMEEAFNYCANLTQWWYTDWRIPNIHELVTLFQFKNLSNWNYNTAFFPDLEMHSTLMMISSTKENNTNKYYHVQFKDLLIESMLRDRIRVMCVRHTE